MLTVQCSQARKLERSRLLHFSSGLLWHADEPVQEDGCEAVEDDKRPQDAEVPPSMRIRRVYLRQKLIRGS